MSLFEQPNPKKTSDGADANVGTIREDRRCATCIAFRVLPQWREAIKVKPGRYHTGNCTERPKETYHNNSCCTQWKPK